MNQFLQQRPKFMYLLSGLLFLALIVPGIATATSTSDEFILGYATAVLQRDFQVTAATLRVQSGSIYIQGLEAPDAVRDRIQTSLAAIKGVNRVVNSCRKGKIQKLHPRSTSSSPGICSLNR